MTVSKTMKHSATATFVAVAAALGMWIMPSAALAAPANSAGSTVSQVHHLRRDTAGPSCDTSWANPVSGSWYNAADWTNGVPDYLALGSNLPTVSACITVPGTYTVTIAGDCPSEFCPAQGDIGAGATALTLGAGAGNGTQTVDVAGEFSDDFCDQQGGTLVVTGSANILSGGALDLIAGSNTCTDSNGPVTLNTHAAFYFGSLTNSGILQSDQGTSAATENFLGGPVTNAGGTLNVNFNLFYDEANSPVTFDNEGAINIADGQFFGDSGQNFQSDTTIVNDAGGSIVTSGDSNSGVLRVDEGNTFEQGGGTTTPSGPDPSDPAVLVSNATVEYVGTGASSILAVGGTTLAGNLAAGQNLTVAGVDDCNSQASTGVGASADFTNAGNITLTHVGPCGGGGDDRESFAIAAPSTMTNTGTLAVDLGVGASNHFLFGNIINEGTIDINTNVLYNNGNSQSSPLTLDNKGRINLADGATLDVPEDNGTTVINDTGGSIVNSGGPNAGDLEVDANDTFQQGSGTTTPSILEPAHPPVLLISSLLDYTGAGASSIALQGSGTLSGNLSSGQNLAIESEDHCGFVQGASVGATGSFTNGGKIVITQTSPCGGQAGAESFGVAGTLTNTGTLEMDAGDSSGSNPIYLGGNFINAGGTVNVNIRTFLNNGNSQSNAWTLDNKGRINLGDGAVLDVPGDNGGTVINDTGGSIVNSETAAAGFLEVDANDEFEQGKGTVSPSSASPTQPAVVLGGAVLDLAGNGSGAIELDTFGSGGSIEGNLASGQNLVIQPVNNCGLGQSTVDSTTDSFTNAGVITFRASVCGGSPSDQLSIGGGGLLTNSGTISSTVPSSGSAALNGNLANPGTVSVSSGDTLTLNGSLTNYSGSTGTLTGGAYDLAGLFHVQDGTLPANGILDDASNITLSGGSFLDSNGNNALRSLATVSPKSLFSLAGGATFSTAGSLTNSGTVSVGGGSALTIPSGALTNRGTLKTAANGADPALLAGNITNASGTVDIGANTLVNEGNSPSNPLTLDNGGPLNLTDGAVLDVAKNSGTTVINGAGGSILNSGKPTAGFVEVDAGNVFEEGAGTTSPATADPTQPAVSIQGSTLKYTGIGASSVELAGAGEALNGNLGSHQNLILQPSNTCAAGPGESASAASFTNAGTITFRPGACSGSPEETLNLSGGTLTNQGTLSSVIHSGSAAISGTVTNPGTVSVAQGASLRLNGKLTNYSASNGALTGGTYLLSGLFQDADSSFSSHGIEGVATHLTLSGGSFVDSNNASSLRHLASIAAGSALNLADGSAVSTTSSLVNSGSISTAAGTKLTVGGSYQQASTGAWSDQLLSPSSLGRLVVGGTSTLGGSLDLADGDAAAKAGTSFRPLTAASRSGKFSTLSGIDLPSSRFLVAQYGHGDVSFTVEGTHVSLSPGSGTPHSSFTVTGSGFSPGEKVAIQLGAKSLAAATADKHGKISKKETVPSIRKGKHTLTATGQTSLVAVTAVFTVK